MECFLHIGTEKTATTTIQNFLDLNRKKLFQNGYMFTLSAGRDNNRALPVAAYNLDRRDEFTQVYGLDSNDKLAKFQTATIKTLASEISQFCREDTKIIFSSEHLQSRLTQTEEIYRVKDVLEKLGINRTHVVVYLRRPADIATSLYSTAIKSGGTMEAPPPPTHPYWHNICHHQNTLEKFSAVFGEDAIIPRLYNKTAFKNGTIIDDFLSTIGIEDSAPYSIPENANKSLSPMGISLLRRLNQTIPIWIDGKPNPLRGNLVAYFEKHFSDSKYIMPKEMFELYERAFKDSNEWLRRKYFPNREALFSSEIPSPADMAPDANESDKLASLITNIWNSKQREMLKMKAIILENKLATKN